MGGGEGGREKDRNRDRVESKMFYVERDDLSIFRWINRSNEATERPNYLKSILFYRRGSTGIVSTVYITIPFYYHFNFLIDILNKSRERIVTLLDLSGDQSHWHDFQKFYVILRYE